jgi:hypothetical protein
MENIYELTVRDLRRILFEANNQDITIKELRKKLFDCENQATMAVAFLYNCL